MRIIALILLVLIPAISAGAGKADSVLVIKSESKLYLYKSGEVTAKYHVSFGANSTGHKQQEGDKRTPEGKYILDYKNANSNFYKSIHISYPNAQDRIRAKKKGVRPGGAIMIHGQKNGFGWMYFISRYFNWTDGCIAVSNRAMDEIWDSVDAGTPIVIRP